jgi:prolyl oligopeptidase
MKSLLTYLSLSFILLIQCCSQKLPEKPSLAEVKPVEDVYFGKKIVDPYRYMENLKDSSIIDWIKKQSDYSRSVLNRIPGRQALIDKMKIYDERKSSKVSSLLITENDVYFYLKTTPEDETGKLYTRNGFEGEEILLYDPVSFSKDTTQKYVITSVSPSDDGSLVAFEIAPNGSENSVMLIMEVKNKKLYPEQIDRAWFGGETWLPDNRSFLYNRINSTDIRDPERQKNTKVYLHKLGSDPSSDKEFFSSTHNPNLGIKPEDIPIVFYDKKSNYLFAFLTTVDFRLNTFSAPASELNNTSINWKRLFKPDDEVFDFQATDNDLYIYSGKNAPNYEILKTSLLNPDLANAEVIVPENPEAIIVAPKAFFDQGPLESFGLTSNGLYYAVSQNGVEAKLYFLPYGEDKATELKLPFAAGNISISSKGYNFQDVWVTISGWTNDSKRFRYLLDKNEFKPENISEVAEFPELADLVVEELMIPSYDGVKVPLSLIYKKGVKKDGKNEVLIDGYGSYGISINPFFTPTYLLWAEEGGIFAFAHVRGGGELGEKWHLGGFKTTKPNTWKDLISCTEYLIKNNFTSLGKVAIGSGSAGGILVGRAMTERPDLFAAVISLVGDMNSVRAEESPNGPTNIQEFGTVKDSVECIALIEMDSYLHIKDGVKYPATLITAGMNDPRVAAWEPAKFAARLEAANASDKPILFWADFEMGHGVYATKSKEFERRADVLSFAFWQTGHPGFRIK